MVPQTGQTFVILTRDGSRAPYWRAKGFTSAMRIGVLNHWQGILERPQFHLKKSVAEDLVSRGLAVWVEPSRVIQRAKSATPSTPPRAPRQLGVTVTRGPR